MSEPTAPIPAPASASSSEEEAWSSVMASWADEAAHRAYLARFTDLEGFAVAGGRYRAVLAERPQDPMALRMRGELLKKATVFGLASLPRTARWEQPLWARRLIMLLALLGGMGLIALVAVLVKKMIEILGAGS